MKRWKRIFRNVAVVFLSTGTILSVPVTACAHVEETAEELFWMKNRKSLKI